jgi:transposase
MNYSLKQVAQRYGVCEATVSHWISTKQLRAINVGRDPGKQKPRWKVTQEALDEFEQTRTTNTPPKKQPRLKVVSGSRRQFYAET